MNIFINKSIKSILRHVMSHAISRHSSKHILYHILHPNAMIAYDKKLNAFLLGNYK